jgi:hypothetical protein
LLIEDHLLFLLLLIAHELEVAIGIGVVVGVGVVVGNGCGMADGFEVEILTALWH